MSNRQPHLHGMVPDWLDVETAGWSLRQALVTLTQDAIATAQVESDPWMFIDAEGNKRWERGVTLPNGRTPSLIPHGISPWWDPSDIHTPALLRSLISGRLIAFGDPGSTGAQPCWIARRQWQQLTFNPDNVAESVNGAGAVFWNVRVIDPDEYHGLAAAMKDVDAAPQPAVVAVNPPKNKGGRPKHTTFEAFVVELIRLADLDGLPETRRELKAHMLDWMAQNFSTDLPSDSAVDGWLTKYAPHKR